MKRHQKESSGTFSGISATAARAERSSHEHILVLLGTRKIPTSTPGTRDSTPHTTQSRLSASGQHRLFAGTAAGTSCVAEGITWVLVYRTDKYKRLKAEVEKQSKKLEKKKETITESAGRQQKKKIERQEEKLKNNNRDLSMVRMKSMFAIGFCFTALMGMFNSIFDGRVVAKLPFIPLSYIQGLSHRNLLGEDYTDCSFIFLYILCTMSIRQNIQKMLGLAPSRAATKQAGGFLGPPPQAGKFS
ncbi:PREDICTED: transmembrane and coiled-coil domain-containing protein 1 [Pygoscelis adeliae]|uniref:transmembrane and coiled-coil domain-containing protein 1 n=1 Tax=Pygoscelis adeliae TaxID=9238 RepID=UPI0004F4F9F4|nr:PREDICTED: transmembrane and coiled-coil domain-containing protein 1 [Pygoscelis adeliae]